MSDFPSTHVSIFSAILAGSTETAGWWQSVASTSDIAVAYQGAPIATANSPTGCGFDSQRFSSKKIASGSLIRKYLASMESPESKHRRFRQYLSRSMHHFAIDWLRRQKQEVDIDRVSPPSSAVEADVENLLNLEWMQDLLASALTHLGALRGNGLSHALGNLLERWIEPAFSRTAAPSHEELARKYGLERIKEVGAILTNSLRMFRTKWHQVLADDLGTREKSAFAEAMRDASVPCHMAKYIDAHRLLLRCLRNPSSPETDTVTAERIVVFVKNRDGWL